MCSTAIGTTGYYALYRETHVQTLHSSRVRLVRQERVDKAADKPPAVKLNSTTGSPTSPYNPSCQVQGVIKQTDTTSGNVCSAYLTNTICFDIPLFWCSSLTGPCGLFLICMLSRRKTVARSPNENSFLSYGWPLPFRRRVYGTDRSSCAPQACFDCSTMLYSGIDVALERHYSLFAWLEKVQVQGNYSPIIATKLILH